MLDKLWRHRPNEIVRSDNHTYIFNYRRYLRGLRPKKALLSYLPDPVVADLRDEPIVRFSNSGLGISWAQVLNELGYIVDIISWDDKDFVPRQQYDLIVFHGGKNYENIIKHQDRKPDIVHFLTGSYWKFNNQEEDKRIDKFFKRHGVKLSRDRYIY